MIIVIGIIAAITIVSYSGISRRATISSIQSDLVNAATKMKIYQVDNGAFPANNNCISPLTNEICLSASLNNTYAVYQASGNSFCINITNNGLSYFITNDSIPTQGACPSGLLSTFTVSQNRSCMIRDVGQLYCWGYGYRGDGSVIGQTNIPSLITNTGLLSGKTVKAISDSNFGHTCVVASDDNAYCWGNNNKGQLGNNSITTSLIPVAVDVSGVLSGKTIKSITTSQQSTCVIASDEKAYCWGYNNYGELGNNSITDSRVPVAVDTSGVLNGKTIKYIASSIEDWAVCVVASDNKPYCWGYNGYGMLGNGTNTDSRVPVAVDTSGVLNGKSIKSVHVANTFACAISMEGLAYCWGFGSNGQRGDGQTTNVNIPTAVSTAGVLSGKTIKSLSVGYSFACVVASDNQVYCWGWNGSYGSLGNNNSPTQTNTPYTVENTGVLNGKNLDSVVSGMFHSCVLASDKSVSCWGYGNFGQLGNNSISSRNYPVSVSPLP